ncbi:MAG: hypothetical protein H6738_18015 [Alphaproteobacteria bacterium]|nr:hypothetical protein [Alphaproteobacteria bacterium]
MTRPPLDLRAFGIHDASGIATRYDQLRGEWWEEPPAADERGRGGDDDGLSWLGPIWHDWGIGDQLLEQAGPVIDVIKPWKPHIRPHVFWDGLDTRPRFPQGGHTHIPTDGVDGSTPDASPYIDQICVDRIDLPPFADVNYVASNPEIETVHNCISIWHQMQGWPNQNCYRPCLLPRHGCWVPTSTEIDAVSRLPEMVIRALSQAEIDELNRVSGRNYAPLISSESDWIEMSKAAIALLRANIDLLEWSFCIAASFNPNMTPSMRRNVWAWLEERLQRGFNLYLVGCNLGRAPNCNQGPFIAHQHPDDASTALMGWYDPANCLHEVGAGTPDCSCDEQEDGRNCDQYWQPAEGEGVLLPGDSVNRYWQLPEWLTAVNNGDVSTQFHRLRNLAGGFVHELLHLGGQCPVVPFCAPGLSPDHSDTASPNVEGPGCWRLQAQTTSNFVYAMSQRYPDCGWHANDATSHFLLAT